MTHVLKKAVWKMQGQTGKWPRDRRGRANIRKAEDHQPPPGAGRGGRDPSLEPSEPCSPANTWVSDLQPLSRAGLLQQLWDVSEIVFLFGVTFRLGNMKHVQLQVSYRTL